MADSRSSTARYTPPNRRNLSRNRLNLGDRTSSQQNNNGERNQPIATGLQIDNKPQMIVTLNDCSMSEAYQLLSQRWAAAMHQYNDPTVDLSERPIMYYGGRVWGKLPHQIIAAANKTLPPQTMIKPSEYMTEVRRGFLMPKSSSSNN